MFWIIALVILALAALEGYYIGAVRAAFAFVALILACLVALPFAPIAKPILSLFGVKHMLLVALLSPLVIWIGILLIVRSVGETANYKLNYYFRYKVGDEIRLLWERLNKSLGLSLGFMNGAVYFYTFSVLIYVVGYPAIQVASSPEDPFMLRVVNQLALGLKNSKMDQAVAKFIPKADRYYDSADIVGVVYQNPHIQDRLGKYPPFLALMDKPEFKVLATDTTFQGVWKSHPSIKELFVNAKVKPLVTSESQLNELIDKTLEGDLQDLKTYLETGKSPKFADTLILGKWRFSFGRAYKLARRANIGASTPELKMMQLNLETTMGKARLTAFPDKRILLQAKAADGADRAIQGTWERKSQHDYILRLEGSGGRQKTEADVEAHIMRFKFDGMPLVFLK